MTEFATLTLEVEEHGREVQLLPRPAYATYLPCRARVASELRGRPEGWSGSEAWAGAFALGPVLRRLSVLRGSGDRVEELVLVLGPPSAPTVEALVAAHVVPHLHEIRVSVVDAASHELAAASN